MNISLTEAAKRSGLSVSFLSQLERGQTGITLISLSKISQALGVTVSYFLETVPLDMPIRRAKDHQLFSVDGSSVKMARVGSSSAERTLEPLFIILPPKHESETLQHWGEEFLYVLKGKVTIRLGKKLHIMHKGDTAHFQSAIRHKWSNPTDEEAHLLWVGTPKLF